MSEAEPFYDQYAPEEWGRLEKHRTEFAVTMRALDQFLPRPPCALLDIGGGPGRYSIELARRGYSVTLMDISNESLNLAKEKAKKANVSLKACIHGNALDMSQIEGSIYEAVLLMGPLYHLLSRDERIQAIREALRVLKPHGRFFASFITRFSPFRYAASGEPDWLVAHHEYALRILKTGIHDQTKKFAKAYFVHPDEVIPMMESCGIKTLLLIGCEGIVAGHEEFVNQLEGEAWEVWVELNYRLGQESTLYGASDHLLYIGEKLD